MARKRPARPGRGPRKTGDSSSPHGPAAGAEESRLFPAVEVGGRVAGWPPPPAALPRLLQAYLKGLGMPRAGVGLRLVGESACRGLNRRFRGIDAPTDVLSFPALPGRPPRAYDGYLGDLALCLPYAWRKRGRFERDFGGEAAFLILHGLLHLSGLHHDDPAQEARMWRKSRSLQPLSRPFAKDLAAWRPRPGP